MAARKRILVVDDEPDIVELVSYNLRKEGYDVSSASDGEEAFGMIKKGGYDLLILDLMLPGIPGIELCRMIRSNPETAGLPIIMLTAKTEEIDRVLGLETGADDYLTKPFSPRELAARIRAVLRRAVGAAARQPEEAVARIGDLLINKETYRVTKKGAPVDLSATEFSLLLFLVERKGKVFSRDQLLDSVWRGEAFVEPRTVDVHIRRLRAQIEDNPSVPVYIKTRRGIGYYASPDV
ncbi:MAG: response regulator [Thermodesulfovibrionales bacterium]|nr:response regulator [Thermodesulfovibrionales bacterium]